MNVDLEESWWDWAVGALAHPVRALAWFTALGALVGPLGGASWVVVAVLASASGLVLGELGGRSRIRTPWLVAGGLVVGTLGLLVRWSLRTFALGPQLVGPAGAVWVGSLLLLAAVVASIVGLLRTLAVRGPAYQAVELFLIGALLANGVASHRDGAMARPLWLSDLTWSFGVDPGSVLLLGGAVMTGLLATLLLLGADRRKPGPGLAVLPLVAVLGWTLAGWFQVLDPPDPEQLFAEAGGEEGASGDAEGEATRNQAGRGEQPRPEPGEGPQPAQPEPGEATQQPTQPEPGEGPTRPANPQPGDGPPQPANPQPGDGSPESAQPEPDDGEPQPDRPEPDDGTPEPAQPDPGDAPKGTPADEPPQRAPNPLQGGGGGGNGPVAVVLVDDDYVPPSGYWYLRQGVLADFNGTRLVESTVPGALDDILQRFPVAPTELVYQAPLEHRQAVHGSVSLLVDHPRPFGPEAPVSFGPRPNPNPARFDRSFHFVSHMLAVPYPELPGLGVGDPTWSEELTAELLEVPDDPRYQELAEQIVADIDPTLPQEAREDPFIQAVTVTLWLGENMKYSKAERHAGVEDPTADFLFGNRIGYCVHSAHASVYLWRALGIPARVATGYAVEEANRRGSTLVVRSGDAHAWSELYVTGVGWVPLDVSPSENLDPPGNPPDEDESELLGEMARHQPDQPAGPRPDYSWIWSWLARLTGGSFSSLVLLVLLAHYAVKLWRRTRPLWAGQQSLSRVGYRAGLDLLVDAGLQREHGETREAFARRLDLPALHELTAMHLRGALGVPDPKGDPIHSRARWTGQLTRLRVELASHTPWWRRILGLFDPSTMYRAR